MTCVNLSFESFIPSLLQAVPELVPVYEEHMIDNFDELLPHVFMGDVTRFVVSSYKNKENLVSVKKILDLLDQAIRSEDEKLQELVSVSFLENLPQEEACFNDIKKLMSDDLRDELALYENKRG